MRLVQAETAIGKAITENREQEQVRIEVRKRLAASEQLLQLGLPDTALSLARDAALLSERYSSTTELVVESGSMLQQCTQAKGMRCVYV